jgi:cysteine-rich repeat protein
MPLRFAITLILAVAGLAATAHSEERHYLLYLSSTTACPFPSGVTNPANFQSVPGARPVLPPTSFNQSQLLAFELCFFNWNPTPKTTPAAEVCQPNLTKGDEVCQQLLRFTASGFTIQSFAQAAGFQSNLTGSTLNVIGGNLAGQVKTSLGRITLLGAAAGGGTFRLQSGEYIESDAVKHLVSNVVIAQLASTCGNAAMNVPPEECDDGNTRSGDRCFRTCERERTVTFSGTPTGVGGVTGSLSGVVKTVPTAGLSTASDVASAMANAFNADLTLKNQSIEVDPIGNAIHSDGDFGDFSSSDSTVNAVPEPASALGLVSGALFLAALGRRRVRC